ncbi:MAG: hypothetical protein Q8R35_01360 [bacterium]|nr:hypothetical protein [bacterium]
MNYFDRLKKDAKLSGEPLPPPEIDRPAKRIVRDIMPPEREPLRLQPKPRREPRERAPSPPPAAPTPLLAPDAPEPEPVVAVHTWEPEVIRRRRLRRRFFLAAAGVLVALGAIVPTAFFPQFAITIHPKAETVFVTPLEFRALTSITEARTPERRLPAIEVTTVKALTREFESSGKKFIQERAHGTVLLYNAYSSAPQSLIANTRIQDPAGKIFRLRSGITIPGARVNEGKIVPTSIPVDVIADEVGEDSNIGPAEFHIPGFRGTPKYQGFYAKSETAFTGGFSGEARIVEAGDLRRASEELTRDAIAALRQELEARIPADPDFLSPEGARELLITSIEQPKAGARYDRFPVTVSARGRVFAIRRSDLGESLAALLLPAADGFHIRLAPAQPALALTGVRIGSDEMQFTVSGELAYWREGDSSVIASVLHASTPAKAEAYLRGREEIASFRIRRFPAWLWFIPGRPGGLEINFTAPD